VDNFLNIHIRKYLIAVNVRQLPTQTTFKALILFRTQLVVIYNSVLIMNNMLAP